MKITSDENVNQAVEQMVQAIRNTDAYLEYQKQLAHRYTVSRGSNPRN